MAKRNLVFLSCVMCRNNLFCYLDSSLCEPKVFDDLCFVLTIVTPLKHMGGIVELVRSFQSREHSWMTIYMAYYCGKRNIVILIIL